MQVRDRIRELRRVKASELRSNARNWRVHPSQQRDALRGILAEVGYAGALLVRELEDGSLELIDGHLRAETTPDQEVPVLVLDVDEHEAAKILATFDPLSAMAEVDPKQFEELLREIDTGSEWLQQMLSKLAAEAGIIPPEPPEQMIDESGQLTAIYQVLVECDDEHQQATLLQMLSQEGYRCRALIA
jgi:ParB-like chromosome segregation protein Spo0J